MVIPDQGAEPAFSDPARAARGVLIAVLAVLPVFYTGALAVQLRRDLDFGPDALGGLVAAYFVTSAVLSVPMGQAVERLGAARSAVLAGATGALALALAAVAGSWGALLVALAVAGVGNALAQPSANLLLSDSIPVRRLGLAFGIKQSCVPAGALLGGLAVPSVGLVLGWRWAFGLTALLAVGYVGWLVVAHSGRGVPRPVRRARLRDSEVPLSSLLVLTAGGFLGAAATTSLGTFLVDSAVAADFAPGTAGWIYAGLATGTILARIGFGWAVDRAPSRSRFGVIAGLLVVGSAGYFLLAVGGRPLFVAGGLIGFALGWGWTGLFHYTIVTWFRRTPAAATGIIQTGLSLGAGFGPLCFGLAVEGRGYATAWTAAGLASLAAAVTILVARAHLRALRRRAAVAGRARAR